MDKQVFNLIHGINCEGFDNSTWDIFHSDGDVHTSGYFGAAYDYVLPEGDYISIWLKPYDYSGFIRKHASLCCHVITKHSYDPDYYIYIYKV